MVETSLEKATRYLRLNPNASTQQQKEIADIVGCSERTVRRALKLVRETNAIYEREQAKRAAEINQAAKQKAHDMARSIAEKKIKEELDKFKSLKGTTVIPEPTPESFKLQESESEDTDTNTNLLPETCEFFTFCEWFSYPEYKGLHRWQKENHATLYHRKFSCTLVPREHGKSVLLTCQMEYALWFDGFDILYLGWTDQRKIVSENIYNFAAMYDLFAEGVNTRDHFKLKNGARFDCYLITAKDVLGMHAVGSTDRYKNVKPEDIADFEENLRKHIMAKAKETKAHHRKLWIAIDDPIDISFMHEHHKEANLERRFNSTLYSINPDKWSFTGTKKFEEDFFYFLQNKFGDDLAVYIRQPYNADTNTVLCPERYTHPDLETYEQDIKRGKKDLVEIMKHIGTYAWSSEWCQDPHPVTGEVWDKFCIIDAPSVYDYNMIWFCIDRATTTNKDSDFTGFTMFGRRNKVKKSDPWEFDLLADFTDKLTITEVARLLEEQYKWAKQVYTRARRILIALEKQGGGSDLYDLLRNNVNDKGEHFECIKGLLEDHLIHNTRSKIGRIKDALKDPLNHIGGHRINIVRTLLRSELYHEIESFPYSAKVDAIDSLALGITEAKKYDTSYVELTEQVEHLREYREKQARAVRHNPHGLPKEVVQHARTNNRQRRARRGGMLR